MLAGLPAAVQAQQAVDVPGREPGLVLPGWWFPAPTPGGAAVLLLHGCGGVHDSRGTGVAPRYTEAAARLNRQGVGALMVDSLGPRGERELCTQRLGSRRVKDHHRRDDALGALQWLAAQPGLDAHRLGVLGWSNGGSTVLAATHRGDAAVAGWPVRPALAVAFYPGCALSVATGYAPTATLLLLLGADDDWTPPAPCELLAQQPGVTAAVYPGAVHGFDGAGPVRLRRDVPHGARPGQGVHVGGDPAARLAAWQRVDEAVQAHLLRP